MTSSRTNNRSDRTKKIEAARWRWILTITFGWVEPHAMVEEWRDEIVLLWMCLRNWWLYKNKNAQFMISFGSYRTLVFKFKSQIFDSFKRHTYRCRIFLSLVLTSAWMQISMACRYWVRFSFSIFVMDICLVVPVTRYTNAKIITLVNKVLFERHLMVRKGRRW